AASRPRAVTNTPRMRGMGSLLRCGKGGQDGSAGWQAFAVPADPDAASGKVAGPLAQASVRGTVGGGEWVTRSGHGLTASATWMSFSRAESTAFSSSRPQFVVGGVAPPRPQGGLEPPSHGPKPSALPIRPPG